MAPTRSSKETVIVENSRSVAGKSLPPIPSEYDKDERFGTILLFYQYKEPVWSKKEHKKALKKVIEIGEAHGITGRGRVAPEGLNCTLSGMPHSIRKFCYSLREWNPLFNETDFKLTDGIPKDKLFKSLSIRKTNELVAYGLPGDKAPSLQKFSGDHLEADEYHKAMMDKDTVIVDVRNAYESAVGSFQPPKGGAQLIDPKMRNSIEFPKWLNDPSTQQKLNGKKVLMYCTGGIRCERATALLNQMTTVNQDLKPKGVYHMRGGIERYIKTFPEGGFWKGKNYLFDRRMEQIPGNKPQSQIEAETTSRCCLCEKKWALYRGKFKCSSGLCGVPVIVCDDCKEAAAASPQQLNCELCKEGYKAPQLMPDLVGLKRKAESKLANNEKNQSKKSKSCIDRLFVSRLPLTITKTRLSEALGASIKTIHWHADKHTGGFYGSCIVQLESEKDAETVAEKTALKIDKKKVKVSFCRDGGEQWPPPGHQDREYPPIGK